MPNILALLQCLLPQINATTMRITLTYLVVDDHFGNNNALQMARQVNLHIISKLRHDSALYIPYQNPNLNKRCRRKYGEKLDYNHIQDKYLCKSSIEDEIQTDVQLK